MTSPTPLPPKEDVAKEIGRLATTLSSDMQNAALNKARELGFDLNKGRITGVTNMDSSILTAATIYPSLTAAQGGADTGDIDIYGIPYN